MITILRWACAFCFLGRAWQHLRWDAPYRALLWSQSSMEGFVQRWLGMTWEHYSTSPQVEAFISALVRGTGWFYLVCAAAALACSAQRRWTVPILVAGAASLAFLAYLYYRDILLRAGEFGEYACQFLAPIALVMAVQAQGKWADRNAPLFPARLRIVLRIAIAATFFSHGIYALGLYPTPGPWVDMIVSILGMNEAQALRLLKIAGILDWALAVGVFIPLLERYSLAYAAAWGVLTALARVVANLRWESIIPSLDQWLHETVMRAPNAALPLALLLISLLSTRIEKVSRPETVGPPLQA